MEKEKIMIDEFAKEILGVELTDWQKRLILSMPKGGIIISCHSPRSKSFIYKWVEK